MRIFLTGASGFIGSALVPELLAAGHRVLGLARSEANVKALTAAGAEVHRGDLENLESLRSGAAASDGVIHCGFVHDFSRFKEVCEIDRRAIEVLGSALIGSQRPLVVTSGTALLGSGVLATEDMVPTFGPNSFPRVASEEATVALAERGVNTSIVRLPQVHNTVKQGLVTYLIALAREKGVSAYVGDGLNRWPAAPLLDTARLYRLVIEKATPGARYHAVDEEGVALRDIAHAIGKYLKIPVVSKKPEEVAEHFGVMAHFATMDAPASGQKTREWLGWQPTGPSLLTDLGNMV